jgi:hypothetical protein
MPGPAGAGVRVGGSRGISPTAPESAESPNAGRGGLFYSWCVAVTDKESG